MTIEKNKPLFVFNMNDECEVALTKVGAEWLNGVNKKRIEEYRTEMPTIWSEYEMERMFPTNCKEGDVVRGLLWEVMEKFGQYFYGNTEAPFKNNSISITQGR